MNSLMFVAFLGVVVACAFAAESGYTTKFDNVDLDEILSNDRLFKKYFDCMMDQGKCTPDAKTLRDVLPDAIQTECSKCNEKQKQGARKVLSFLRDNKRQDLKALLEKYDPSGERLKKYEELCGKLEL